MQAAPLHGCLHKHRRAAGLTLRMRRTALQDLLWSSGEGRTCKRQAAHLWGVGPCRCDVHSVSQHLSPVDHGPCRRIILL
jgi:hypothetical protein